MDDGDRLVRQFYARILLDDGGVLPLGDFAEVNSRQGRTIQLKFLNVVQVEDFPFLAQSKKESSLS
jgi:hypothetical protein